MVVAYEQSKDTYDECIVVSQYFGEMARISREANVIGVTERAKENGWVMF